MKNFIKNFTLSPFNVFATVFLLVVITFSIIRVVNATAPNPGHDFTESSGGIVQGDIVYGSATDVFSVLTKNVTATRYLSNTGTSNNPAWAQVNLTNGVTGITPVTNGGTGAAPSTDDQVLVSDSASAATWRTINDCTGPGKALQFAQSSNTWGCNNIPIYNQSVTTPAAVFATDTYLVGSSVAIPTGSLQVGTRYHMIFQASKTAAGVATPILNVRFGTGGSTADTALCTLTFTAQTAATDTGTFEVWVTFRTVGSGTSAVLQCAGQRRHGASITGFGTLVAETKVATSGGFNSTVASSIIGVSVNGGASAAWTITLVQAELENLN